MTREEAIDWLARVKSNTVNHTLEMPLWWNEPLAEALDMAIKALEQEPRWISVSERLPEDHKDVLAYLSPDRISICRYNSHKLPFSNNPIGWGYVPGIGFIDFEKENVIAWMPLPEPYES